VTLSPPMRAVMEVIGDTVVATNRPSEAEADESDELEQAARDPRVSVESTAMTGTAIFLMSPL